MFVITYVIVIVLGLLVENGDSETSSDIQGEEMFRNTNWNITGPFGGFGGVFFTDWWSSVDNKKYFPKRPPQQINIRAGGRIDSIQFMYGPDYASLHGAYGGTLNRIRLYDEDRIIKISGRAGQGHGGGVDQLTLHTKNGKHFGPYGGQGGDPFQTSGGEGCYLAYISGRADQRLDQIIFHWRCPDSTDTDTQAHLKNNKKLFNSSNNGQQYQPYLHILIFLISFYSSLNVLL